MDNFYILFKKIDILLIIHLKTYTLKVKAILKISIAPFLFGDGKRSLLQVCSLKSIYKIQHTKFYLAYLIINEYFCSSSVKKMPLII